MSTDRELADLTVASVGYQTTVFATDRAKVQAAKEGTRTPSPRARLAIVAWELYLRDAPPPPVPPSPLANVFKNDALYINTLGNFDHTRRDPARASGYQTAYVQLLHTSYAQANEDHLHILRNEGWTIGGWGTYGQGSDPLQDGKDAAAIVRRLGLACWKANGEAWAEGADSWKTEAFLQGWRANGGSPCPLGWSVLSSDTANFARNFAYDVALSAPGADIDIQVYGATYPSYTVGAGLGMLSKVPVPVNRTTMTFDVTASGDGPFADYRTWSGPRRIWVGEWCDTGTFAAMAR